MELDFQAGAMIAREALEDKIGMDTEVLDLRGLSNVADYFVIGSASNINQLRAMADQVEEKLFEHGFHLSHSEGYQGGGWILLDYGSLIVHLFLQETRDFYQLERIWADAKRL